MIKKSLSGLNNKLDILCIGAHPDDVELGCGGTIAKAIARGKKVGILDLTGGELGTRGSATIRANEAKVAAKILGIAIREHLGFKDGFFQNDEAHQRALITVLRAYQPHTVLCPPLEDRHPDHPKAASLVKTACFLSGLPKIKSLGNNQQPQEPWRPTKILHYIQWQSIKPDLLIDISEHIETKIKAVKAYKSQFYNPHSEEPSTPISSLNFLESVQYRAKDLGRYAGVAYAEGFISHDPITLEDDLSFLV